MVGTLDLPDTKTTFRKGTKESVTLTDDALVMFLAMLVSDRQPGDKLYSNGPALFRRRFSQLVQALSLQNVYLLPYSLRRGGATHYFLETGSLDLTAVRGRWQNIKTCRIYIDEALRDKATMDIKRPKLIRSAARILEKFK